MCNFYIITSIEILRIWNCCFSHILISKRNIYIFWLKCGDIVDKMSLFKKCKKTHFFYQNDIYTIDIVKKI